MIPVTCDAVGLDRSAGSPGRLGIADQQPFHSRPPPVFGGKLGLTGKRPATLRVANLSLTADSPKEKVPPPTAKSTSVNAPLTTRVYFHGYSMCTLLYRYPSACSSDPGRQTGSAHQRTLGATV